MFIKRKTRAGKTYAYRMLLSFETSLTCNFFLTKPRTNVCSVKELSSEITRLLSDIILFPMLIFRPVPQQNLATSNLASGLFFSFYSRLSSLHEIVPYISKSFRNGATYSSTVLNFDFCIKYWTTSGFLLLFWKISGVFRSQTNIYDGAFQRRSLTNFSFTCGELRC